MSTSEPTSGKHSRTPTRQKRGRPAIVRENATPLADGVSHRIQPDAGSLVPMTPEEQWMLDILRRENLPDPTVKRSNNGEGPTWTIRSRGDKIGRIKHAQVEARRADLLVQLAEERRSISVDLVLPLRPTNKPRSGMPTLERDPTTKWADATGDFFAASDLIVAASNLATTARHIANEMGDGTSTHVLLARAIAQQQDEWRTKKDKPGSDWHARRARVELTGRTFDLVRKQIDDAVIRWQKAQLTERFPMRREGAPIPLRAEAVQLRFTEEGLDVGISAVAPGWRYFGGSVRGHAHLGLLKREHRVLGSKLKWDERKKRWRLDLAIGLRRKPPTEDKGTMVVRVGVRDILYGLGTDGWLSYFRSTQALLAAKQGFLGRKANKRGAMRDPSSGRSGHGKAARYRTYQLEADKEARYTKTWWGQTAQKIVGIAKERGYGTIVVVEPSKPLPGSYLDAQDPRLAKMLRRFPSAAGRDAIVSACDKAGLAVRVVDASFNPVTCPACGCPEEINYRAAREAFLCISCDLELNGQFVAAWNTLAEQGVDCSEVARRAKAISKASKDVKKR